MYTYICTYIKRERERERERDSILCTHEVPLRPGQGGPEEAGGRGGHRAVVRGPGHPDPGGERPLLRGPHREHHALRGLRLQLQGDLVRLPRRLHRKRHRGPLRRDAGGDRRHPWTADLRPAGPGIRPASRASDREAGVASHLFSSGSSGPLEWPSSPVARRLVGEAVGRQRASWPAGWPAGWPASQQASQPASQVAPAPAPSSTACPELDSGPGPNGDGGPLRRCQGDCDRDGDCEGALVCFQRDGDTEVLGAKSGSFEVRRTAYDGTIDSHQARLRRSFVTSPRLAPQSFKWDSGESRRRAYRAAPCQGSGLCGQGGLGLGLLHGCGVRGPRCRGTHISNSINQFTLD